MKFPAKHILFWIYILLVLSGYGWLILAGKEVVEVRPPAWWPLDHWLAAGADVPAGLLLAGPAAAAGWLWLRSIRSTPRWLRQAGAGLGVVAAGLATWYLRVGRSLGDAHIFLEMLAQGRIFRMSQPLTTALYWLAYAVVRHWGWPVRNAVALACSLAAAAAAWLMARLLARLPEREAWAGGALVLPCALGVLFCGYVETTAPALVCVLAFFLLSHMVLHDEAPLWKPALALGLATACHGLSLYLVPVLILLAGAEYRKRRPRFWRQILWAALALVLPVGSTVGTALVLRQFIRGTLFGDSLGGPGARALVPLLPPLQPPYERYTLFSAAHAGDVVGIMLLVSPFSLLALLAGLLWGKGALESGWGRTLGLSALAGLAFVFLWNADLGMKWDWDLFGPPLVPLLLFGAHLLAGRASRPILLALAAIAALNTALFLDSFEPRHVWSPTARALPTPPMQQRTDLVWQNRFELLGFDGPVGRAAPGQTLGYTLYFRGLEPMPVGYTTFLHVVDGQGNLIAQHDHQPYPPTEYWIPGETVTQTFSLAIPPDIATPVDARILVGAYFWQTLERLPLLENGRPTPDNTALLAEVSIYKLTSEEQSGIMARSAWAR